MIRSHILFRVVAQFCILSKYVNSDFFPFLKINFFFKYYILYTREIVPYDKLKNIIQHCKINIDKLHTQLYILMNIFHLNFE